MIDPDLALLRQLVERAAHHLTQRGLEGLERRHTSVLRVAADLLYTQPRQGRRRCLMRRRRPIMSRRWLQARPLRSQRLRHTAKASRHRINGPPSCGGGHYLASRNQIETNHLHHALRLSGAVGGNENGRKNLGKT